MSPRAGLRQRSIKAILVALLVIGSGAAVADTPGTNLIVSPSSNLFPAGQSVTVSGTGFGPSNTGTIQQCIQRDLVTEDCSSNVGTFTTGATGLFGPISVTVQRSFTAGGQPATCSAATPCSLFAQMDAQPQNAHEPISFTGGSLPGVVTASVNWKLRDSLTSGPPTSTFTYGTKPLVPIVGDWDGNGTKTSGTFEAGVFKLRNSNLDGSPVVSITFGNARGFPVVGDWNADGTDDLAVFRTGVWQTRITGSGATSTFNFGPAASWPAVVPVAGDWNGDRTDGIGVYNLSGGGTLGEWNLRQTASGGSAELTFSFGGAGVYPVTGDWDANGTDGIGTKVIAGSTWSLRQTATAGAQELSFTFGVASDFPIVWRN